MCRYEICRIRRCHHTYWYSSLSHISLHSMAHTSVLSITIARSTWLINYVVRGCNWLPNSIITIISSLHLSNTQILSIICLFIKNFIILSISHSHQCKTLMPKSIQKSLVRLSLIPISGRIENLEMCRMIDGDLLLIAGI